MGCNYDIKIRNAIGVQVNVLREKQLQVFCNYL